MAMLVIQKRVCHTPCGKVLRNRNSSSNPDTHTPFPPASRVTFKPLRGTICNVEIIHPRPVAQSKSHPDFPKAKGMKRVTAVLKPSMAYAV